MATTNQKLAATAVAAATVPSVLRFGRRHHVVRTAVGNMLGSLVLVVGLAVTAGAAVIVFGVFAPLAAVKWLWLDGQYGWSVLAAVAYAAVVAALPVLRWNDRRRWAADDAAAPAVSRAPLAPFGNPRPAASVARPRRLPSGMSLVDAYRAMPDSVPAVWR